MEKEPLLNPLVPDPSDTAPTKNTPGVSDQDVLDSQAQLATERREGRMWSLEQPIREIAVQIRRSSEDTSGNVSMAYEEAIGRATQVFMPIWHAVIAAQKARREFDFTEFQALGGSDASVKLLQSIPGDFLEEEDKNK